MGHAAGVAEQSPEDIVVGYMNTHTLSFFVFVAVFLNKTKKKIAYI